MAGALADIEASRARCSTLLGFIREAWPILEPTAPFVEGWAVKAVIKHLEAVSSGDIQYLLINIPPGCMKSLLVGVFWPAFEWGPLGRPTLRYLSTSYSKANVLRDNGKMRKLIESDWFQALWPNVKPSKKWGEVKFANTVTGEREGRPFSSMTGGRGDRVLIDDPHSTETAESDAERKTAIRILREAIPDRMNDTNRSAIVVIMQRLHTGDASGTLLELNPVMPESKRYVHLCLPMRFDPGTRCVTRLRDGSIFFVDPRETAGELLFPERFDDISMQAMQIVKGPYAWSGQYQQEPNPREGALFDVDKIVTIKALPAGKRKTVRAWDFAASIAKQGTDPDWTATVKLSRDDDGFIYIEHVARFRRASHDVKKEVKRLADLEGSDVRIRYPQDPGASGKSVAEDFGRVLAGFSFHFEVPTGSKENRATPVSSQVGAGNVRMLEGEWNRDFIDELRSFPTGGHDDMVDAFADAFNELAGVVPGEGLIEYYRQEAAKVEMRLRGEQQLVARSDWPVLKCDNPAISMALGRLGKMYERTPEGFFVVHPDDAGGFLAQMGWSMVSRPTGETP